MRTLWCLVLFLQQTQILIYSSSPPNPKSLELGSAKSSEGFLDWETVYNLLQTRNYERTPTALQKIDALNSLYFQKPPERKTTPIKIRSLHFHDLEKNGIPKTDPDLETARVPIRKISENLEQHRTPPQSQFKTHQINRVKIQKSDEQFQRTQSMQIIKKLPPKKRTCKTICTSFLKYIKKLCCCPRNQSQIQISPLPLHHSTDT